MRRVLILIALASALAVTGCGGGGGAKQSAKPLTKAEYQAELQQIAKDVAKTLGTRSAAGEELSQADVDKVVKAARSFTDRLEDVNPPAEVAELHTRLVQAMTDLGDEFPEIARKLNDAKDASEVIAAFLGSKAAQELARLQTEFKAKDYNLNLNG